MRQMIDLRLLPAARRPSLARWDHSEQAIAFIRRSSLSPYDKTDNRTERAPIGSSNCDGY